MILCWAGACLLASAPRAGAQGTTDSTSIPHAAAPELVGPGTVSTHWME